MKYLDELLKLDLPVDDYAVFGSGPLAVRGLIENNDVDIVVRLSLWKKLLKKKYHVIENREIKIGNISIFNEWLPWSEHFDDVNELIDTADVIDGIRYVHLNHVKKSKKILGRKKDIKHLKVIDNHLNEFKKIAMKPIKKSIYKEYDIRGAYPSEISESTAYALGVAFAKVTKVKNIVVGRDARVESEKVFWPLIAGLASKGVKVIDLGVCATPELFFAVGQKKFPAGCMVTASHSPAGQTGFKFCSAKGVTFGLKSGLQRIANLAEMEINKVKATNIAELISSIDKKVVKFETIAKDYRQFAISFIKEDDLANLKIVMDASNGSGARLADMVFGVLPTNAVMLNFRAGDAYPDHGPNPLLKENQKLISLQLKKQTADLGVIFDGDADRAIFFDETGKFIEPYYINCLLAQIVLQLKPRLKIVVDARLNLAIAETIKKSGGQVLVHRSGYANIIKTMTQKNILFGCENSGHFMFGLGLKKKTNYVYGDAIIPILLIASYLKRNKVKLSQAIAPFMESYKISGELNFSIKNFAASVKRIKKAFIGAKISELDGLSMTGKNGEWFFNLRPSHTEPLVRLNVEAKTIKILGEIGDKVVNLI